MIVGSLQAADYGVQKQFWAVNNFTNVTGTVTNLASVADVTQYNDFQFVVFGAATNACAGTLDVVWTTSGDNSHFCSAVCPQNRGWFSIPLTNLGTAFAWQTNVTVTSLGYWKVDYITNSAGQSITNITVNAYAKPTKHTSF